MVVQVGLVLAAHRLQVAADGPELHRRVLRPGHQLVVQSVGGRINVSPPRKFSIEKLAGIWLVGKTPEQQQFNSQSS